MHYVGRLGDGISGMLPVVRCSSDAHRNMNGAIGLQPSDPWSRYLD
jgi:hypothetical protein